MPNISREFIRATAVDGIARPIRRASVLLFHVNFNLLFSIMLAMSLMTI